MNEKNNVIPSLEDRCINIAAINFEKLTRIANVPVPIFLQILEKAINRVNVSRMQKLEKLNPRLICPEIDERFWKYLIDKDFARRKFKSPYHQFMEELESQRTLLENFAEKRLPVTDQSNDVMQKVIESLILFDQTPFSPQALVELKIGKIIKKLSKNQSEQIQSLASNLVRKWTLLLHVDEEPKNCENEQFILNLQHDKWLMTEFQNCHTWRDLYYLCEKEREQKLKLTGKRLRERQNETKSKRPKTKTGSLIHQRPKKASGANNNTSTKLFAGLGKTKVQALVRRK